MIMVSALWALAEGEAFGQEAWVDLWIEGQSPGPSASNSSPASHLLSIGVVRAVSHQPFVRTVSMLGAAVTRLPRVVPVATRTSLGPRGETAITVSCGGGITSWDPDDDVTVYGFLYVGGQRVDYDSASGFSPSIHLSAAVEPGESGLPVQCYIEGAGVFANATGTIAPRLPSDLRRATNFPDEWDYRAPGDYTLNRKWQVWDNYGLE
jgi:hypothetical protein